MAAEPPAEERACQATFVLSGEGHTLANPLKHQLNRSPHVELAGYSVPHYSENAVNVRVQTTGEASAKDVMLCVQSNFLSFHSCVR